MLKQVLTLSGGSTLGKIFGVVREVLFAALFGTSAAADAYRAAMTATLAPVHLFTSEALNAAFIPQFRKDRADNPGSAWSLFNGLALLLLFLSLVAGGVLYFFAHGWISLALPGFVGKRFELAVRMLQIMAWGVPLYVLSALLIALEIANGQFKLAALRPFLQNVGVITAITAAFLAKNPVLIAWWFTGTYFLFSIYEIASLLRKRILQEDWHRHWDDIRPAAERFWWAIKPMVFFSLILQANILLEKAVASLICPGAVATTEYARLITETAHVLLIRPIGLVGLSAMVTIDEEEVRQRTDRISAMVLLMLVPLSGFLLVSAPDIVRVLYGRGAFDERSIALTSQALRGMAVGMWAVSLSYVMQRIYNSRMRNHEVLLIGAAGIIANAVFNIAAYRYLGVLAIGLGVSLCGMVMAGLYIRGFGVTGRMRQVAKVCIIGIIPYVVTALFLNKYPLPPLGALAAQAVWCTVFWGGVFTVAPASREILQLFMEKLVALKGKG